MFSLTFDTEVVSGSMEDQRSHSPAAESLFTMQKEILPLKEVQTVLLKLQNHFSWKNLSAVRDLKTHAIASSSKHKAIQELRLMNEISQKNFSETREGNKRDMRRVINGKQLLTDSSALRSSDRTNMSLANASGSKFHGNSHAGKQVLQDIQIEQLSKRLEFLEKESKIMRQEFLEQVEEREKLVNEVYQQFQTIYYYLQLENPEIGESGSNEYSIVNT